MAEPASSSLARPPLARSAKTSSSVNTLCFFAVFVAFGFSCATDGFAGVAGATATGAALAGTAAGAGAGIGAIDCAPTLLPSAPTRKNPATAKIARHEFILPAPASVRSRIIITFPIGAILRCDVAACSDNAIRLKIHERDFKPARGVRLSQHLGAIVERQQIGLRHFE